MNDSAKVLLGFISGLAAGITAGVLLAPDKGDSTRKLLAEKAKTLSSDVSGKLEQFSMEKINEVAKSAMDSVKDYANKMVQKEKEQPTEVKVETVTPEPATAPKDA